MSVSLVELFDAERQGRLRERLGRATNLRDVADAIQDELAGFAHIDGPYVKGLTKSELSVAMALLALVRESKAQAVESAPREQVAKGHQKKVAHEGRHTSLGSLVTVSASLGASAGFFLGAVGGIVGAALVGAGATLLFGKASNPDQLERYSDDESVVKLDTQKVCDGLLQLFERIDNLVRVFGNARTERPIERPPVTLAEFPEFLRLFQLMWSALANDSKEEMVAIIQRQFPSLLRGQGLEVVRLGDQALHEEPSSQGQLYMCDVDYSAGIKAPTLDYPPIRAKDVVVLRGRVLLPTPSESNN